MYYGGLENVPGAPGNPRFFPSMGSSFLSAGNTGGLLNGAEIPQPGSMVAGSPGYMLDRDIIEQRMDRNDMRQRGLENFRFRGVPSSPTPVQSPPRGPQLFPLAQSAPGTVPMGNAAGIANAEFYRGPQFGQMPVGFAGKTIS